MDRKLSSGINISSAILGVLPTDGRMIISIESGDEDNTSNIFEAIRQMPGVISAALVYHQYETDPDEEA
ncbi:MAG: hypothetical protein CVU31_04895 [Betaproteobacteria bacterium HGW-Betaproteobacteria-4]|nr:MAG: hypothetical protein CVU31_04895 [Betaproteobacteria bacterium HGW-Betaproteobacteria-4]